MATAIHYSNESSTIDALWTILKQQSEGVRQALATRLAHSLAHEGSSRYKNPEEALAFVRTLSIKDGNPVPADEDGIETLINQKYI